MPRYIDADALMLKIDDWRADLEVTYGENDDYVEALRDVLDIIENAPTADVVERKKGKWIKKMRIIETDKYASYTPEWYCSCCGEGYKPYIAELISFCPNCGADMREEKPMTRNEAIDVLKANYPDAHYSELREAVDLAVKVLEEPERKKGKWIKSGEGAYELFECSLCGKPWLHWYADAMDSDRMSQTVKCCPNCGADMREKEKTDDKS